MKLRLAIVISIAIPGILFAQGIPTSDTGIEVTPSAANPAPGQEVTITARSYTIDINSSNITWAVDGKTVEKGIGATVIKVTAPALGKVMNVSVSVVSEDGVSFQESIRIASGYVDMIVESNGYTPPMFPGKIAPVFQNTVKITAVPHVAGSNGVERDPKTLVYRWEQSGNALESQSGYAKQSVTVPGTLIPRPYTITVYVSTRDGTAQGTGIVAINPVPPSVIFYKNDPLYGPLYNNAIAEDIYLGAQREMGIVAVPYGFNLTTSLPSGLEMKWLINSKERPELAQNQTITLRAPGASAGTSNISLTVKSGKNILQQAAGSFRAVFSASATSSSLNF